MVQVQMYSHVHHLVIGFTFVYQFSGLVCHSDDDKHSKRKKRKKNKRSKSPSEAVTLLENEWVDPWARKPSKPKSEEPKVGRYSEEADEKKKKKKKSKKNKRDKEIASPERESERLLEKTRYKNHLFLCHTSPYMYMYVQYINQFKSIVTQPCMFRKPIVHCMKCFRACK